MIGAFAVLDLLVSLVTYSGHPLSVIVAYLASGVIAAQAAFLAVLHALGPGPLIRRTLIAWSLGAACVLLWFLGVAIYHRFRMPLEDSRELLASMTLVPFFVLALETPLWLARLTQGWRLAHPDMPTDERVSLGDLFTLTTIAAATLGLAQFSNWLISWGVQDLGLWITRGIACGILAIVGGLLMMHLLWRVLQRREFVAAMLWAIGSSGLLTAVVFISLLLAIQTPWIGLLACGWGIPLGICSVTLCLALERLARSGWLLKTSR
jgi:hypothetical protein